MNLLEILAREAKQLTEHPERQRPRERLDDIRMTQRRQLVDQLGGDRRNPRLELCDPARCERARDEPPDPVVQRRVELDDVRHLGKAVGEHVRAPRGEAASTTT